MACLADSPGVVPIAWAGWMGGSGEVELCRGDLTGPRQRAAWAPPTPAEDHPGETPLSPSRVFSASLSLPFLGGEGEST